MVDWPGVVPSLSFSGPVALSARESRKELSPMEGPGPLKKEARGGSRGASKAGSEGAGVPYSELTVESGRSSAMAGGKEEVGGWTVGKERGQGEEEGWADVQRPLARSHSAPRITLTYSGNGNTKKGL